MLIFQKFITKPANRKVFKTLENLFQALLLS